MRYDDTKGLSKKVLHVQLTVARIQEDHAQLG